MKTYRVLYWIFTGLLCLLMLLAAGMYFVHQPVIAETFEQLGYPAYLVYPLAVAKILGVVAILTKKSKILKDWAYAGFFYDFVLAATAHIVTGVQTPLFPIIALVLLVASYIMDKKIYG